MANTIKIKRKTTTGAPSIGSLSDGEMCLVVPDSALYQRVDGSTLIQINGGGGGGAPTENIILTATKTAGQNVNGAEGTETDLTWDAVSQDSAELTTFSSGDSDVVFTNAGWVNLHASAYITNGTPNNRTMMGVALFHYDSTDTLKYSYWADMQYLRDDNVAYDSSGGAVSLSMMKVEVGDYVIVRTRIFDDGTAATVQTLNSTYSKLRIAKIVF